MPDKETVERAREDAREGKSPSTQAGEFVREEIDHIREGKHRARSTKQAIAIGLSKARRAGVSLPPPRGSTEVRRKATQDSEAAGSRRAPSKKRSRATTNALKREGTRAASKASLSSQARTSARSRGAANRSSAAKKAARTRARNSW
jgi:Family of unknown function (DUF6496)